MDLLIRPATSADIPAIAAIYGHSVATGTASFELDPPDAAEMARRQAALVDAGYPYLAATRDRVLLGYAYAGAYRPRPGYRHTVEDSVYVAPEAQGRGIGGKLLDAIIAECEALGFRQMIAVIGDAENVPSIRLHQAHGFAMTGTFNAVGHKFGRWLDCVVMQRPLGSGLGRSADPPMTITPDDIEAAAARIVGHVRETPVFAVDAGTFAVAHPLSLKLELFQHTGSFKPRGAFNNLLSRKIPAAGVVAASGGNHGAAVAFAAHKLGINARIFVPTSSSKVKVALIKAQGAEVTVEGDRYADALALAEAYAEETGALQVQAYNAAETIAGQGTVAREWQKQAPGLDTLLIATGGGGLIAGIAAWHQSKVKVVSVEPERARCLHAAFENGRPLEVPVGGIAVDSLGAAKLGDVPWTVIAPYVAQAVLVTDEAIAEAQQRLWRETRIAAEPGGACALAALTAGAYRPSKGERVGVLICGGNVDLAMLKEEARSPLP